RFFLGVTVLGLFLAVGCSSLPSQMPPDFSVEISASGGMLPYSTDATYSLSGCRYEKRYQFQGQPVEVRVSFVLDAAALRALYRKLADGQFDRITTHREEIYDRGGFQVTVTFGGKRFTVVDGGQSVVDVFWLPSWKAIYEELSR